MNQGTHWGKGTRGLEKAAVPKKNLTYCTLDIFTSTKYSWYSFLLEAESTREPQCGWKDYVNEKLQ